MTIGQTLANARAWLQRRFSNKPNIIQTRSGATPLAMRSMHPHWIVGRDLCMYRCESFEHVPKSKRRSALALKLPVWSPFERTGHHSVWAGGLAMVWLWNADEVEAEIQRSAAVKPASANLRILPETVFFPRADAGTRLLPCRQGFELQYWRNDILHDSYWLTEPPSQDTVSWFVGRQAGADAAAGSDDVRAVDSGQDAGEQATQLHPAPWANARTPAQWLEANERALVASCALALVLVLAWQETRAWKLGGLEADAAAEFARLQEDVMPVVEARGEWLELQQRNGVLRDILLEPSQAYLMGVVDQALPSASALFRTWRYQQRELSLVVEDGEPNPIEYIRALEAQPLFQDVKTQPTRWPNRLEVTLKVAP